MLRRLAAASACLLFAAPALRAQSLVDICRRAMHPPAGAWARYRLEGGRENGATVRMAIVGSEAHGDTTYLWVEMAAHGFRMGGPRSGGGGDTITMVNKMLVPGIGPGMAAPREVVMKLGSGPAMVMPISQAGSRSAPGSDALRDCRNAKVLGWESVTVPAGTFRALHVQNENGRGDSWVVPDLPFALVRMGTGHGANDSTQMVLLAHGSGARSEITETPRPYDPRLFMQMMMPQGGRHQ
ncbi:MAG TPA: hypothetical protein VMF70_07625 [Gemmatimonadales bacterium]|nr:hypothetical protein [Gemmatimonadales bacterium]